MTDLILPHGGILVNRMPSPAERERILKSASAYRHIPIDMAAVSEIEMIANGALSPLTGFMNEEQYHAVLNSSRLPDGTLWPVPITLTINQETATGLNPGDSVILADRHGNKMAFMNISSIYKIDFAHEITMLFESKYSEWLKKQQQRPRHRFAIGGDLISLQQPERSQNRTYCLSPAQTRACFKKRGWQRVAAFSKPNPIGFSKDSVETCILEIVDGLFFQPAIIATATSQSLVTQKLNQFLLASQNYYPNNSVIMGRVSRPPRFSEPHEAILSAIIRKNFGCSHYLISEKQYMRHSIISYAEFRRFVKSIPAEDLDITLIFSEETIYCRHCKHVVPRNHRCIHQSARFDNNRLSENSLLQNGSLPPLQFPYQQIMPLLVEKNHPESFGSSTFSKDNSNIHINPRLLKYLQNGI